MKSNLVKIMLAISGFAITIFLSCADNPALEFPSEEQIRQRYSSSKMEASSSSAKPGSSSIAPSSSSTSPPPSSSSIPSSSTTIKYGSVTDDGGRTYKTVEINYPEENLSLFGNPSPQVWMAENLNYNVSGSVCYDGQEINCGKYGRLYNWATAMKLPLDCNSENCADQIDAKKHRGICPVNWHIPTEAEWSTLIMMTGGKSGASANLKAKDGWNSIVGKDGNGIDAYGFTALPGGSGNSDNDFSSVGNLGSWWGNRGSSNAYTIVISTILAVIETEYIKSTLISVRCIKD